MQEAVEKSFRLKRLCSRIVENPQEWNRQIKELQELVAQLPRDAIQRDFTAILSIAYLIFKNLSESKSWYVSLLDRGWRLEKLIVFCLVIRIKKRRRWLMCLKWCLKKLR